MNTIFQTQTGNVDAGANGNHFSPSPEAKVGNENMNIFDPSRKVGESRYGGRCLHGKHEYIATHERDGGMPDNPGIFLLDGGVIEVTHCRHCEVSRTVDTRLGTVTYREREA